MPDSHHLSSQFDEDLSQLRSHLLQMGGLVETQVAAAIEAYSSSDVHNVESIVAIEHQINELEKAIDDNCAHIIAKRQPAASDLRLVLGVRKIVTDLERSGDEAKKIAKGALRAHETGSQIGQFVVGVQHLTDTALRQMHEALNSFARLDTEQARRIIQLDNELDIEFRSILRQLITHMMEDPGTITTAIEFITIVRAIERIGDHAKNISEQVIYIVEGRDVRHIKENAQ